MNATRDFHRWFVFSGEWLAAGAMFCVLGCLPATPAAADNNTAAAPHDARRGGGLGIEDRVNAFARTLGLNATQQSQLKKILLDQREAVRKIWSDKALLPAERAPATRAANERTGDEIRAILNDEQRKKYNPPPQATPPARGDTRTVEQWMESSRPR